MAAGGGFRWLTQKVFYNRLHIFNHMSVHTSLKTVCARAFLIVCENV